MNSTQLRLTEISERLPTLEKAKKAAASARNFKEAGSEDLSRTFSASLRLGTFSFFPRSGNLSKEIKSLEQEKQTTEESCAAVEVKLNEAQAQAREMSQLAEVKRAHLDAEEREIDLVGLRITREKAMELSKAERRMQQAKPSPLLVR
jgi:chromosome segregation ATPase